MILNKMEIELKQDELPYISIELSPAEYMSLYCILNYTPTNDFLFKQKGEDWKELYNFLKIVVGSDYHKKHKELTSLTETFFKEVMKYKPLTKGI